MELLKYCPKCKLSLSYSAFYKSRSRHDGIDSYCKNCKKNIVKENRKNKPELFRAIEERRKNKDPEKRAIQGKLAMCKWRDNHPEKNKESIHRQHCKFKEEKRAYDKGCTDPRIIKLIHNFKNSQLKKYGITLENFNDMIKKQNNLCAICFISLDLVKPC